MIRGTVTMMGSSLETEGRVGGLKVARSNLSGIISRMILPTDEVGFGREVTRRRVGGGVAEKAEGVNFAEPFRRGREETGCTAHAYLSLCTASNK